FLIDLEGHGREHIGADVDLSRTIGWFTTLFPVRLNLEKGSDPADALKSIKEQLRRIPDRGLSYGVLRYLSEDDRTRATLSSGQRRQVLFNYLGQLDQIVGSSKLFSFADELTGPLHHPQAHRSHLLDILCFVRHGRLQSEWIWDPKQLTRATVGQIAKRFCESLRAITVQCCAPLAGGRTPSDHPLADIDQATLDQLWLRHPRFEDVYPLTPMQRLFFLMHQARPEIGFEQWQFRIEGELNPVKLRRAFEAVIARHPILRTVFPTLGMDTPVQVVLPEVALPWV